jgi:PAS domain S-box-containing protein
MGEDWAVDAMRRGAYDYLLKDRLARLGEAVRTALERRRLRVERTGAVDALRESQERYRLVSEISSDYAYSLNVRPDGSLECEWITDPFTRATGFTAAEINSIGWTKLYSHDDRQIWSGHYEALLSNQPATTDVRIVTKDRQIRWVRIFGRPIWDGGQHRVIRIYGAAQDNTTQKHLEQQLLQSQKMEAIGRLAGGVAHDFNNLLTVILGYGQVLKEQAHSEQPEWEHLDEILKAAERAAQLTNQLLAFSRRQILRPRSISLNTVVADLEKMLRRLIGEDIELLTSLDSDLGLACADPGQIEQVIMNLVVNARDAMPSGGKLTIETGNVELDDSYVRQHANVKSGSYVMLAVSDTGVGMDAQTIARIFEPFFTTKEMGKGTGLGLATVFGIVEQSEGNIWVYSEPGQGTSFKVYLPRLKQGSKADPDRRPARSSAARGSGTILVVEDENSVRALSRSILSRAGYTVLDTGDVDEALRLCEHHPGTISLLMIDVVLPKMSGPETAERALQLRPEMQVLYSSGYTDSAISRNAVLKQGAFFLEKPFTPDALIQKVQQVLNAGTQKASE